jgi:nicotinate-nucleotide adenylyltransferase
MSERIGLYGGSFDPIHFGHLISARSVAERLDLSRVILIPSARPPHKQGAEVTEPRHRLAMARVAVKDDPLFEVSDVELRRAGPSYTFDTVEHLGERLGTSVELFWIIGGDSLPELPTWYRIAELVSRVRIVTATRPGWEAPAMSVLAEAVGNEHARVLLDDRCDTPAIDISASDIRARVGAGRAIRYLLPEAAASYIATHGLYTRSGGSGRGVR